MKITDQAALHQLRLVRSSELEQMLDGYPENERDGRSDLQMVADEAGYLYSLFTEGGTALAEIYEYVRKVLRETKNGKEIPLLPRKNFCPKYTDREIDGAKDVVNEYRRLGRLINRLAKMGIYSQWL